MRRGDDADERPNARGSASAEAPPSSPGAAPSGTPPAPTRPTAPPLTAAQLKDLLLTEDEARRAGSVERTTVQSPVPPYAPGARMAGADCQGVFEALVARGSSAWVIQDFWWMGSRWAGRTWLASYAEADAERRFQRLRDGLTTCRALRGTTPEGQLDSRVSGVRRPALGDEAVSFALSMTGKDGAVLTDHTYLVRVGPLLVGVSDRNRPGTPRFPLDHVADRQLARVEDAPRT
ncbi:hypothetical protein [Streptomyces sp. G45]|uniref:hypothetical protein n=1 Tax=Streptomyces sp. G45 TaxID=3406627 RepID=UPI003C17244B